MQRVSGRGVFRPKWDTSIAVLPKAQRLLWNEWQSLKPRVWEDQSKQLFQGMTEPLS